MVILMDNPFLCSPKHLGKQWRALRAQLTSDKTDLDHLNIITKFWAKAPLSAAFLDWDSPDTWPDPWELISEMTFDASAIALGMKYTLLLAEDQRWSPDRLALDLICLVDKSKQLLMLTIDNSYILNFEHGQVTPIAKVENELVIQQRYLYSNKMHLIKL